MATNWTVRDYVDFEPGFRMGLARRQQNEAEAENRRREQQFRELQKERAVLFAANQKDKEDAKLAGMAHAMGRFHGSQGNPLTPELMQNPDVLKGYFEGADAAQAERDREKLRREGFDASLERSQTIEEGRIKAAKIRAGLPLGEGEGQNSPESLDRPFTDALDALDRLESSGSRATVSVGKDGFPKVSKTGWWFSDASDPGSYLAQRQKIEEQWKAARTARQTRTGISVPADPSMVQTNRQPVLKYP